MPQHLAEGPELPQQSLLAQFVAQQQAADAAMEVAAEAAAGAAATATTAAAIHVGKECSWGRMWRGPESFDGTLATYGDLTPSFLK
jgi:hypothetical protein